MTEAETIMQAAANVARATAAYWNAAMGGDDAALEKPVAGPCVQCKEMVNDNIGRACGVYAFSVEMLFFFFADAAFPGARDLYATAVPAVVTSNSRVPPSTMRESRPCH